SPLQQATTELAQTKGDLRRSMIARVHANHDAAAKDYYLAAQRLVELTLTLLAHDVLLQSMGQRPSQSPHFNQRIAIPTPEPPLLPDTIRRETNSYGDFVPLGSPDVELREPHVARRALELRQQLQKDFDNAWPFA